MARGSLRIYLGAAPGVGKTYAMLNEGRRRHDRGTDVVVGYVETHGRQRTAEQIGGLETVPRRRLGYRGQVFEEMDLDAVIARHPRVALVDELAHTNVPGSRHAKRWQDVDELLDAGIDVISTVNIQHLESLNDVVEGITGIRQRETIPDAVVRAAEQIEVVDSTPEALRRRMAHGNIYAPEKIDAALANYFRPGNLTALRELALLWVADRVEESLQDYRERHGIDSPWETREKVAVALTGSPGGDHLVRRAGRIASRTKAGLVGIHVHTDDGLAGPATSELASHRRLLEELGGAYRDVVGNDIARTLVRAAQAEGATQLVLGASRRSRWAELTRGSVIGGIIREAGRTLDLHVISTLDQPEAPPLAAPRVGLTTLSRRRRAAGFALLVAGLPALTAALTPFRSGLGFAAAGYCYLLMVMAVATVGGALPALLAALTAFGLLNWYFAPPIHTFTISNSRDIVALVTFLLAAGVVSGLVDVAARRREEAHRARSEAEALAGMAGALLREGDPVPHLLASLVALFGLDGAAVVALGPPETPAAHRPPELLAAQQPPETAPAHRPPETVLAQAGSPLTGAPSLVLPIGEGTELRVAGGGLGDADRDVLAAFAAQLAVGLESHRLQVEAANAAAQARANELRSGLLAAVSHDLRTPLASIKAASSSLLSEEVQFPEHERRALLETIDVEADRLSDLVGNLLDMSRIQAGAVVVQPRAVGLEEVIAGALSGLPAGRQVLDIDVAETLPPVQADPVLLERALANIVDNAVAFAPPGQPVRVEAGCVGDRVDLRVIDTGPGIPVEERERVFQPFQRLGDSPRGASVGLGLAVARGFVVAMGGEVTIDDTPGGGTTMVVSLPGVTVTRLLIIDDEERFARALGIGLRAHGYEVDIATSGEEGLVLAAARSPEIVVLDLGLPGMDGLDVLRGLRAWTAVPVIVLSARHQQASKVDALDEGADDYVTKPFGMDELLARLRAVQRRGAGREAEPVVATADFVVDLAAKRVTADGSDVHLTPKEWQLLEVLVRNPGKLVPQRHLLQEVWGPQYETETDYLRVFIAGLRRKLEPEPSRPRYLITEPGMGYRFEPDAGRGRPVMG